MSQCTYHHLRWLIQSVPIFLRRYDLSLIRIRLNQRSTKRGDQGAFQVRHLDQATSILQISRPFHPTHPPPPLQKLERGELKIAKFYERFGSELSDPRNKEYYTSYMQKLGLGTSGSPQFRLSHVSTPYPSSPSPSLIPPQPRNPSRKS
ncbi:hypothetical protein BC938DRAFT_472268 [Jimgerdemannia flammicorona]|uniref:Uncharacterized protein n=1 Tax=Jimgerdemannia flammicorona TaxID=994334 RepID=A0A433Q6J3_9FUNG|nr:hypothetical protein BC938DRAFT_472268 [Jimgerdemannia flammicorona]